MPRELRFHVDQTPEPVLVTFDGIRRDGSPWQESFEMSAEAPGVSLILLGASLQTFNGRQVVNTEAVLQFFRSVCMGDARDRFEALMMDPERLLTTDKLSEVVEALGELYGYRPTGSLSASAPGPARTSRTSREDASWPVLDQQRDLPSGR